MDFLYLPKRIFPSIGGQKREEYFFSFYTKNTCLQKQNRAPGELQEKEEESSQSLKQRLPFTGYQALECTSCFPGVQRQIGKIEGFCKVFLCHFLFWLFKRMLVVVVQFSDEEINMAKEKILKEYGKENIKSRALS